VVGITSKMGSLEAVGEKEYTSAPYRVSKAAENMLIRYDNTNTPIHPIQRSDIMTSSCRVRVFGGDQVLDPRPPGQGREFVS
jgi:hypothetical protein